MSLTTPQRRQVWKDWVQQLSDKREALNVSKAELKAAIDGIDEFLDNNQAEINKAIPLPARTNLTARQKAELLSIVVLKRFKVI
jgi:hypothetical protein